MVELLYVKPTLASRTSAGEGEVSSRSLQNHRRLIHRPSSPRACVLGSAAGHMSRGVL